MEMDSRTASAKNGVQTMLFYYLTSLIECGVKDPKQRIATEIGSMIDLSEEQYAYVMAHTALNNKAVEMLSTSVSLLERMEKSKSIDAEAIHIVTELVKSVKEQCEKAVSLFGTGEDVDVE